MIIKRFDNMPAAVFLEMIEWCQENLYHGGNYEPNWDYQFPTFYFKDEKEYVLFALRWA